MKLTLCAMILLVTSSVAAAPDWASTIRQEGEKSMRAAWTGEGELYYRYLPSRVRPLMGTKENFISLIKLQMADLKEHHQEFVGVTLGDPSAPRKTKAGLVSIAPLETVMKLPGGRRHESSSLLAISEDNGVTWTFADLGPFDRQMFREIYPELTEEALLVGKVASKMVGEK